MSTFVFAVFLAVFAANLFFQIRANKYVSDISKCLLMPLLLTFYILKSGNSSVVIVLALISGFLGDFFLAWSGKDALFAAGLLSFLVGHVFYSIAFIRATEYLQTVPLWFFVLLIPYAACGVYIYKSLKAFLGRMKVPFLIYCPVILLMSFFSLTRLWSVSGCAFWLPFIGSLLFITSDTILSFNIFKSRSKCGSFFVMATYVTAQLFIVSGFINT